MRRVGLGMGVSAVALALSLAGGCSLFTNLDGFSGGGTGDAASGATAASDAAVDGPVADAGQDGSTSSALGCGGADAGLLGYWRMDEGLGTTITDCSGHGLDGTLIGTGTWVAGRRPTSKAVLFDSSTATYIDIPASALADAATTVTVAAWVNFDPAYNSYPIHKAQPPEMSWSLEMEADNSVSFYVSADGSAYAQANAKNGPTGTWFHLAAVYEPGKKQTVYVNGVSVASALAPATMFQKSTPMKIGWHTKGMIDEVRVFSRALSDGEITALAAE